jgi:arylsulfatase A-like enzyme
VNAVAAGREAYNRRSTEGEDRFVFKRLMLMACLTLSHCLLSLAGPRVSPAAPARPNFVFFLTDDHRWDALGCAGNPILRTPNIDRLAAGGIMFRNHFVTTSICAVSRASIFSGQQMRRHGIADFATGFSSERWAKTYPALLRAAGYRTGFIGKFGVGTDAAVAAAAAGFDYWRGLPGQAGLFFDADDPGRTHKSARFGNEALEFIRGCRGATPFCLSISFNAPHARDNEPREFWPDARDESLYEDAIIPVPRKASDAWFRLLPEVARNSEGRIRWAWRFDTPTKFQATIPDYYRLISGIDREVGRIVDALRDAGLDGNTVVIFTGDNGFFFGERGMADKWLMYEESIRVPCIVFDPRMPDARRGARVGALTLNIDFAPTMLELAGLPVPQELQGASLGPWIRGDIPRGWRTEFFYEHKTLPDRIPPVEGVRGERWKYVRWTSARPPFEELFDLASDPGEERNLASEPAKAAILERWRTRSRTLGEAAK